MHLKFLETIHYNEEPSGEVRIKNLASALSWKNPTPALRSSFKHLSEEGAYEASLADHLFEKEGEHGLILLYHALGQLKQRAFLAFTLFLNESVFLTLRPISPLFNWHDGAIDDAEPLMLSPYASSFFKNGDCVLETPLNAGQLILQSKESIALIKALRKPTRLNQLSQSLPHLPQDLIENSLKLLKSAKLLHRAC